MATAAYDTLLPEIIPMVPGCPDTLIENYIRAAVIELCEKAGVYQAELDPLTTQAGVYEYDLDAPFGTVVDKILWVTHKGRDLEPISTTLLEQRKPKWREEGFTSTPEYFVKVAQDLIWIVPVPNETIENSTIIRAILKPTHTSTFCESQVLDDYRDAVINGTLYRLLRLPSKDWTDYSGAQVYGSLFAQDIVQAERKARHADMPISRKVNYGGVHRSRGFTRKKYGREVS